MWSDYFPLKQDSQWGAFHKTVTDEAEGVLKQNAFCSLISNFSVIKVSGDDAQTFLQGQLTCDFKMIAQGQPALGAHCNVKGRVQSSFLTWHQNDCFYLALPSDTRQPTLQALNKYAAFSKVNLTECDDLLLAGFGGAKLTPEIQSQIQTIGYFGAINAIGQFAAIPQSNATNFVSLINNNSVSLFGDNAWQLYLIQRTVALISASCTEEWSPHELNYDLINAVSFNKGCYKGQEIIARIQYRGRPKVRTFGFSLPSNIPIPSIGEKLTINGANAGVLAAALASTNSVWILATLKIEVAESNEFCLDNTENGEIERLPLNYAIPN